MNKYEDIINLSRPISKHPKLSITSRAAQFSPFSALTGYDEQIKETARYTEDEIFLDENTKDLINEKLDYINKNINNNICVSITHFVSDENKKGGKYITTEGIVTKIKAYEEVIVIDKINNISMNNIKKIEIIKN